AFRLNRRRRQVPAVVILAIEVVAHSVLAVLMLGTASGFQFYLLPLLAYLALNQRLPQRVVLAALASVTAVYVALDVWAPPPLSLGAMFDGIFRLANLVIPTITSSLICYVYRRES